MANKMSIKVFGVIENYSYIECPGCNTRMYPFGESHIDAIAEEHGISSISRLPINPKLAAGADSGLIELFDGDWLDSLSDVIENL